MGAAVGFDAARIQVVPGETTEVGVRVRNTGQVVDQFDLDVLGEATAWTAVEPASVNLLPGAEQTVRLRFSPPRSPDVAAGDTTIGLRVLSHEDTAGSVIEEVVVSVAVFTEIVADLVPRTSRGSRRGRHELAVDNAGNSRTMVDIQPLDPDRQLEFRLDTSRLDTEPGTATFVDLQARPVKRFLRGQNKTLPFEVTVTPEGGAPQTVSGSMLQEAVLPKWLMIAALAVAALVAVMMGLWYTVIRPEVQSTARQAVERETDKLAETIASAQSQAASAAAAADEAKEAAGIGPGGPGAGGTTEPTPTTTPEPRGPAEAAFAPSATDLRITTETDPGTPGEFTTFTSEPPEDKLVWVSDMVLQNPRGDSGILQVRRGEDVLFEVGLDNFRDLDYHFIQPVRFSQDEAIVVAVDCRNPGTTACTPAVYFTGQILPVPSSPAPAVPAEPGG
jgi:type II secretory pathway pseudopilin PulG